MPNAVQHYIYLVPQRDGEGTVSWTWMYDGKFGSAVDSAGKSTFPPVIAAKGSGQNDIHFTIVDPARAIKFAGFDGPDPSQAIWLSPKGSPTEKQPVLSSDGQVPNITFSQDGIQLSVPDKNNKKIDFVYQLNFVDTTDANHKVTAIDPEVRNGGGNTLSSWSSGLFANPAAITLTITAVVAVALIAGFVAKKFL